MKNLRYLVFGCFLYSIALSTFSAENNLGHSPIEVVTPIKATAEEAWNVLIDFPNYRNWNRWVVRLDGQPIEGETVHAFDAKGRSLDLKITSIGAPNIMCWVDVTWFTNFGVGGWRCRSIETLPNNQGILFKNHFEFTGVFGGALDFFTRSYLANGMRLENESLRDYLESLH